MSTDKDKHEDNSSVSGESSNLSAQLEELFSAIILATDNDGRVLSTAFTLLPSKKVYPAYYEVIDDPIDLKMIATKIQNSKFLSPMLDSSLCLVFIDEYGSLGEMERDLSLMWKNAWQFNETGSPIYKDAKTLKRIVSAKKTDIEQGRTASANYASTSGKSERIRNRRLRSGLSHSAITAALQYEDEEPEEDEEEPMEEDEDLADQEVDEEEGDGDGEEDEDEEEEESKYVDVGNPIWLLYEAVCNHVGSSGAVLSEPFRKLPSKRYYPDYYKEVKNPISLGSIKMKIQVLPYGMRLHFQEIR